MLNGLGRAENNEPGFLLDLVTTMLASRNIKVNMTEKLLMLQGNIPESEGKSYLWLKDVFVLLITNFGR